MDAILQYLENAYLRYALFLAGGYLVVYIVAFTLARFGGSERTVIFHCRRAWQIAFVVHALAVTGFTIRWFSLYGYFPSFWSYFPCYLAMLLVDLYIIVVAGHSINRFSSY